MSLLENYVNPRDLPASEAARVGLLLALPQAERLNDVALARCVTAGLAPDAAAALGDILGPGRVIGPVVPEAALRQARQARTVLSKELSERLYEVSRVVDALGRAFHGDRPAMDAFLNRPHPLLDGATPFDMTRSGPAGADAVLNLIRQAEAGVAL